MVKRLCKHEADGVFDPDAIRILSAAFDDAWKSVQVSGAAFASDRDSESVRDVLAKRIVELAKLGERDQGRLCEGALAHWRKEKPK